MCLITRNNPIVADEDILVYKVFNLIDGTLYSPLLNYEYITSEPESVYLNPVGSIRSNCVYVDVGYHSFRTIQGAMIFVQKLTNSMSMFRSGSNNYVIRECIIPSGATYYKGVWSADHRLEQYTSNRIIIK